MQSDFKIVFDLNEIYHFVCDYPNTIDPTEKNVDHKILI